MWRLPAGGRGQGRRQRGWNFQGRLLGGCDYLTAVDWAGVAPERCQAGGVSEHAVLLPTEIGSREM